MFGHFIPWGPWGGKLCLFLHTPRSFDTSWQFHIQSKVLWLSIKLGSDSGSGRLGGWEVGWCKDSSKRMRGPALNKKVALRPTFWGSFLLKNLGYCWWKKSGDHHVGCKETCINWCRISSINNIFGPRWSMSQVGTGTAALCRVRASGF